MVTKILFLLSAWIGAGAFAGDTPFLNFDCRFGRTLQSQQFTLRFHDDDSQETYDWATPLKQTQMHFIKNNHNSVSVQIVTGIPILSEASPEQYNFTAPLSDDQFNFSVGVDPLQVQGDKTVILVCTKQ